MSTNWPPVGPNPLLAPLLRQPPPRRRKVFVSYHHGNDRPWYEEFSRRFAAGYELVHDHSVERTIGSEDADYVVRRIHERYLTGASCTIVLCGSETPWRKYVDWEILASLNQRMGLVGLNLPTNPLRPNGRYTVPDRLNDNIQSGYAPFADWDTVIGDPASLLRLIERSLAINKTLIYNSRYRRLRNGS